jgi:hypothetical protein
LIEAFFPSSEQTLGNVVNSNALNTLQIFRNEAAIVLIGIVSDRSQSLIKSDVVSISVYEIENGRVLARSCIVISGVLNYLQQISDHCEL